MRWSADAPHTGNVDVTRETRLAELCTEPDYSEVLDGYAKSLKDCLRPMRVKHLKVYTEDDLKTFVREEGGPAILVPRWLRDSKLEDVLDVGEFPSDFEERLHWLTKKKKEKKKACQRILGPCRKINSEYVAAVRRAKEAAAKKQVRPRGALSATSSGASRSTTSGSIVMSAMTFLCAREFGLHECRGVLDVKVDKVDDLDFAGAETFGDENAWSEVFVENLRPWLDRNRLEYVALNCEEGPRDGQQSSFQVRFSGCDVLVVVGLVPPGWHGSRRKARRMAACASEWHENGKPVFGVELYVSESGKDGGRVRGVAVSSFVKEPGDKKQSQCLLRFKKAAADGKAPLELLSTLLSVCAADVSQVRWTRHGKNVAQCGGDMIVKSYYYDEKDGRDKAARRDPFVSRLLIPAKLDGKSAILWYSCIKGSCGDFSSNDDIEAFLARVRELGEMGVIMGDIRRRNWVGGTMIDFDYSVCKATELKKEPVPAELKKRHYPANWNVGIDDGARHPNATAGKPLEDVHDVYAACMALLVSWGRGDFLGRNVAWKMGLLCALEECTRRGATAKTILDQLIGFLRETRDEEEPSVKLHGENGTGSPPTPDR